MDIEDFRLGKPNVENRFWVSLKDRWGDVVTHGERLFMTKPLKKERLLEGEFDEAFHHGWAYSSHNLEGALVSIVFNEDETAAQVQTMNGEMGEYSIDVDLAKELMEELDKRTLERDIVEVTMGPRRAQGPATKEGRTPRDTSLKAPDVATTIKSFLQGGKKRKTRRRHKRVRS